MPKTKHLVVKPSSAVSGPNKPTYDFEEGEGPDIIYKKTAPGTWVSQ